MVMGTVMSPFSNLVIFSSSSEVALGGLAKRSPTIMASENVFLA